MKMNAIMDTIKELSQSQGFYGRLLANILAIKEKSPSAYDLLTEELEGQNFKDPVDMILYFEC